MSLRADCWMIKYTTRVRANVFALVSCSCSFDLNVPLDITLLIEYYHIISCKTVKCKTNSSNKKCTIHLLSLINKIFKTERFLLGKYRCVLNHNVHRSQVIQRQLHGISTRNLTACRSHVNRFVSMLKILQ